MTQIVITQIDEAEETRRGELIAEVLQLRKIRDGSLDSGRYRTAWGTKTALGLYRTMERLVKDGE